jgi:hypothetical protein
MTYDGNAIGVDVEQRWPFSNEPGIGRLDISYDRLEPVLRCQPVIDGYDGEARLQLQCQLVLIHPVPSPGDHPPGMDPQDG